MAENIEKKVDLIVIGAGLAGMAATIFAVENGLTTIQVGSSVGEMLFASGALDLLGIHPVEQQKEWLDPWAGVSTLSRDCPKHPYALLGLESIRRAMDQFVDFLENAGLSYRGWPEGNALLPTCAGTIKITYRVPQTMWPGVTGFKQKLPALIVDFQGMKDFSARQMVETLGSRWPGLRSRRLDFTRQVPGVDRDNALMAEALNSQEVRTDLAGAIRPLLQGAELVGIPAVLGLRESEAFAADLEGQLGVPVFEIPTMPPSVPGIRLKEAMEQALRSRGANLVAGGRAVSVNTERRCCVGVVVQQGAYQETLEAEGIVLATGRFLGGGLDASRTVIRETLLDLQVHQPERREAWHRPHFLDPRGHPVNRAGLEVDELFRPVGSDGRSAFENLFAVGSVLAHQDWMRMKCGAGLAISTAYGAVQSFIHRRG
ncbi:MAG: glycerol-3-phosphate dehydrogenase subunit GlpB [Deltaproteobacteria bacterium]|nr:MAG: glycerol-3-phosphate dehydrogenase subunit GlpB [Deltaproteobacteria bacterium]